MRKIVLLAAASALMSAMTVEQYLNQVRAQNPIYRATEMSADAAMDKLDSGEIALAPVLTATYQKGRDKSLPNQLSPDREMENYTLGVAKKFVTGTSLEVKANVSDFKNSEVPPMFVGFDHYATGILGVSLKQSLWKDFFGYGTRATIERMSKTSQIEAVAADLQNQGLLADAEGIYWDYVYAQEDLKLKKANSDRANQLNTWMIRRVQNGTGERVDGFNSGALKSVRELEYLQAQTNLKNAEMKFREALNIKDNQQTPVVSSAINLNSARLLSLTSNKRMVQAQAFVDYLDAQARYYSAEETVDQLRPDLNVFGTYNYTAYENDKKEAVSNMTKSDYPQYVIGANLVWQFDTSAKRGLAKAAKKQAEASKLMADKKLKDGEQEWQKFVRDYQVLADNLKLVEQVADLQKKRASEENARLTRGRTITANVITAETESAEASINLLKTKIGLLKMEAAGRTFINADAYLQKLER